MSRTYKHIRKWKTKKFWDDYYSVDHHDALFLPWTKSLPLAADFISKNKEYSSHNQLYTDYNSAPSWFTRLFSNIPKRREEKELIKKILLNPDEADSFIFPTARKPFAYYY